MTMTLHQSAFHRSVFDHIALRIMNGLTLVTDLGLHVGLLYRTLACTSLEILLIAISSAAADAATACVRRDTKRDVLSA